MDKELYDIMKSVYARWTGEELADVIAVIRREIEEQRHRDDTEQKIKQLQDSLDK